MKQISTYSLRLLLITFLGLLSAFGVNAQAPVPTITSTAGTIVSGPFTITIKFDQEVQIPELAIADILFSGATLSNLVISDRSTATVLVTPTTAGPQTIQVVAGAVASFPTRAYVNQASNIYSYTYAPDVTPPSVSFISIPSRYYLTGDVLSITMTYSENLIVNTAGGTPYMRITIGSSVYNAMLANVSGNVLRFDYTIASGNLDLDGVMVNPITLNGGTIRDAAGNNAGSGFAIVFPGALVDAAPPVVTEVSCNTGMHAIGSSLIYTVKTSEGVTVSGRPTFDISIGGTTRSAQYVSNGGSELYFVYNVQPGELDMNGVEVTGNLSFPGGSFIRDGAGNNINPTLNNVALMTGVLVNAVRPTPVITGPSVVNGPFTLTITFDDDVNPLSTSAISSVGATASNITRLDFRTYTVLITPGPGSPSYSFEVPGGTVTGMLSGNSNVASAIYNYTVDQTPPLGTFTPLSSYVNNGIGAELRFRMTYNEDVLVAGGGVPYLELNIGSTSRQAALVSTSPRVLEFSCFVQPGDWDDNGVALTTPIFLNGGTIKDIAGNDASLTVPTYALAINADGIRPLISDVTEPADRYYKLGETLLFGVSFDELIYASGSPTLQIKIGAQIREADLVPGPTLTTQLNFQYHVAPGEMDEDGIEIIGLNLNGATIKDASQNDLIVTTLVGVNATPNVKVNTTIPSVTLSSTAPLLVNAPFTVTAGFSEAMPSGLSTADINASGATISNVQPLGSTIFTFTVTPTVNGVVTVDIPAGRMSSVSGNVNSVSNTLSFTYDDVRPGISFTPPADRYYREGETVTFTFRYNEDVLINTSGGIPYYPITFNGNTERAYLSTASGSHAAGSALEFSYTVKTGDVSTSTGLHIGPDIVFNGATMKDAAGNDAETSLNQILFGAILDAVAPKINTLNVPMDGYHKAGDVLDFLLRISEDIVVGGSPVLNFTIGSDMKQATFAGLSGTNGLIFSYTVVAGDNDEDGIVINTVDLNGGTLKDNAGNDLDLTPVFIGPTTGVLVNTIMPSVVLSSSGPGGLLNAPFPVKVTFSEAVTDFVVADISVSNGTAGPLSSNDGGISYETLITPVADGPVAVEIPANVALNIALNGNTASAYALTRFYDSNPPDVISVNLPLTGVYRNGDVLDFTVNFNEIILVSGAPALELIMPSGNRQAVMTGTDGNSMLTFSYTIRPEDLDMDGISLGANILLNGGTMKDIAANDLNTALTGISTNVVRVDGSFPEVNSVFVPINGYYKTGDNLNFIVFFNRNITVSGSPILDINIGGNIRQAVMSTSTANSISFSYTVAAEDQDLNGIGISALSLNGGTITGPNGTDANLTLNGVGNMTQVFVYSVVPAVTFSGIVTNSPFTLSVIFSEGVTGFDISDIVATNATLSDFRTTDNITYTVLLTPAAQGTVTLKVPANAAVNIAGRGNAASSNVSYYYDGTPPVITSVDVPSPGHYKQGDVLSFVVHFSEAVALSGPALSLELNIGGVAGIAPMTGVSGNQVTFVYTVQPTDDDADGIQATALQLNGATIRDLSANDADITLNNVADMSLVRINNRIPSVTLSGMELNKPFTLNIVFSEAVTGFGLSDISLVNATVSALQTTDYITYTVLFEPASEGPVSAHVRAGSAQNTAGTDNTVSNTIYYFYDSRPPVITSVDVPAGGYYKNGDRLDFAINFSENVTLSGFSSTLDLNIGGVVRKAAYVSGYNTARIVYAYVVDVADEDMNGIEMTAFSAAGEIFRDPSGNDADLTLNNVGNTNGVFVHNTAPSVQLSGTPSLNRPFTVNIVFNERVTGFSTAGIATVNAAVSDLQTTDDITFTATVTPASDGPVNLMVLANAASNVSGLGNTTSNVIAYTYDATIPVVTSVDVPTGAYYKAGDVLNFSVHFSENVTLSGSPEPALDLNIGGVTRKALYVGGDNSKKIDYAYTVVAADEDMDGIQITALTAATATFRDQSGNDADLTLNNTGNTNGVFVHNTVPSVQISGTPSPNEPFTLNIVFSEKVTGFDALDVSATNAAIGNLQTTDNISFTATVTPVADGAVSLHVPANIAVNVANTGNTVSNTINYNYDGTAPVVDRVEVPLDGYYKAGAELNFTVRFSEPVNVTAGTPSLPVVIGTNTVQAAFTGGNGTNAFTFRYVVQAGEMDMNGIALSVSVNANSSVMKDVSGNDLLLTLNGIDPTTGVFVNTDIPSVILSTTADSRVNTPFDVTVTFSEEVNGLIAGSFNITNGTAADLRTSDNIIYTVTVTPSTDGPVSIQLPAAAAANAGGNGNTASNSIGSSYDGTAPVITAGQSFNVNDYTNGLTIGTVNATEATGTLQNWTIATDASGGAFVISANGTISIADAAKARALEGTTVTLGITVSDGLNTSANTTVNISMIAVNKAPSFDVIDNVRICWKQVEHVVRVTGITATEPSQQYTISATSPQDHFEEIAIDHDGLFSFKLKPDVSGTATITVKIKDDGGTANGGIDEFSRTFTVTIDTLPDVKIASNKGTNVSKGDMIELTATGAATYAWLPQQGIISGQNSAMAQVRPLTGPVQYVVLGKSAQGCEDLSSIDITLIDDFKVDAVNVMTPNGDGINDRWIIRNIDAYQNNEVKIFNRSGQLIFQQRNYNNTWDGKLNGRPLEEGTYYYILTIENGAKTAKGFITILRNKF